MNLYQVLNHLNISYEEMEHVPVYSVKDIKKIKIGIPGIGCKNLFLTDHDGHFYLYVLIDNKKANLKDLAKKLKVKNLSFASFEELKAILKLDPGSVTPFGILNDLENKVTLIFDRELENNKVLFHRDVNTKTLSLEFGDLLKFIQYFNHQYIFIEGEK